MQGLRERKRADLRQAISDVATRLFEQRGFEQVTMAEIADAAGVSRKTVFNHFGAKEELFFDAEDAIVAGMVRILRERPPGVSPTAALRPLLLDGPVLALDCRWSVVDANVLGRLRAFAECEAASPTLSAHRLRITQSWVAPLAEAAGSQAWASLFAGALCLRQDVLSAALREGRTPRTIERRLRSTVGEALDALERAFPETGA